MIKIIKKGHKRLFAGILAGMLAVSMLPAIHANAAVEKKDSVTMRLVFTTDLHGTVGSKDYISGISYENQGLAKAINLIRQAREEMPKENVITLDAGDFLFSASMEYIYGQDETALQPILKAMTYVGYDAITLGNHEFDYGKTYLMNQLMLSGLLDKVVVSNLTNARDGSYPFQENMLIERQAETAEGKKVTVKVGIIGETIPTLSTRADNYAGVFKTEDIVENVRKEADKLRQAGADFIVVAAHSGFGTKEPAKMADNVVYALTKEEGIDVILCGHEHLEYPSEKNPYNSMDGVDETTGLINDKVVIMAKNNGISIGVSDVTLAINQSGECEVIGKNGELRRTSDYKVKEDDAVLSAFDDWKEEIAEYRSNPLITLAKGEKLDNYLGVFSDSPLIQLQNDARISYARKYIEKSAKQYAGYPVIAASTHSAYGSNSWDDFTDISGTMNYGDLFGIQNYRDMTYLYRVTGAQLKEWLEFSASAYRKISSSKTELLLSDEYLFNWSRIYLFDGINYTISPYAAPRYDSNGKKISDSNRITSLTYQGQPVTDDMEFVVASNILKPYGDCFKWASSQIIRGQYRSQVMLQEYFTAIAKNGEYHPAADNNWRLDLKEGQKYLALVSANGTDAAKADSSFEKVLNTDSEYNLIQFKAGKKLETISPYVVVSPQTVDPSMLSYSVYVDAFSPYGIKTVRYSSAYIPLDSYEWNLQRTVDSHSFTVYFNSDYYIYAEDSKGNKSISKITINNIGVKEMAKPKVYSFNNMKSSVTGTGEVMATAAAVIDGTEYTAKVQSNGTFSISVPEQEAGKSFYVYQKDTVNNRKSDSVKIYVRKNGPATLSADKFYNNMEGITGVLNDEDSVVFAVVDEIRTIYVPEGELARLEQNTALPKSNYNIVEVKETIFEDGTFLLCLPDLDLKTSIKLYNVDRIGRTSRNVNVSVLEGGPFAPELYCVNNAENIIYGKVKSVTSVNTLKVTVIAGGKSYITTADEFGCFNITLSKPLAAGETVSAYAVDTKNKAARKGRVASVTAADIAALESSDQFKINPIEYNSYGIYLKYQPYHTVNVVLPYVSGTVWETYEIKSGSALDFDLKEELVEGSKVFFISRDSLGEVIDSAAADVSYKKPANAVILNRLNNTVKTFRILTDGDYKVNITIGDTVYVSEHGTYNDARKGYVHTIPITKVDSGTKVKIQVQNQTAFSDIRTVTMKKKAPDTPSVSEIKVGAKQISGKVEVFLLNSKEKATVKNSDTRVYAKINGKLYRASIAKNGTFKVKVPTITKGMEIKIFAYNIYGYGPILVTNMQSESCKK